MEQTHITPPSSTAPPRCVAIVGGGTAGHVYPALAIAEAYRRTVPGVRLLFLGTRAGFEARLVEPAGYRLELIPGSPLFGVGAWGKLRAVWNVFTGMLACRRLFEREGVHLVIGFGGYVSAGPLLAARSLGICTAIHEANAAPGLANRLLGRIVERVYLGFAGAATMFPRGRTVLIGTPTRPELVEVGAARAALSVERPRRILVTGGSQGSPFLNRHAPDLLGRLARRGLPLEIRHQVGNHDLEAVRSAYERAGLSASVVAFIDGMPAAYAWADFAVTCAGMTLGELAAAGLPALLVPLSGASEDHQTSNARQFAIRTGALWVREDAWEPDGLAAQVAALLCDAAAWAVAAARLRRHATPEAAPTLVADCEAMLARRRSTLT